MNNSLTKIWVVILLLAGAFGAFIFWSIKSYNESKESIQSIVMPDVKSAITNTILKSAIQSDLHLHNFILTNDTIQRKLYLENVKNADSLIHELGGLMQNASLSLMQLDTLRKIIDEKTRVNTILIELKKQQSSNLFTQQALNRIKTQISDSAYIDKVITKEHELIAKRDTIELKELIQYPDDYKGLSGFFRKLFGRERIRIDTLTSLEEQINYSLAVSIDSNIVRDYFIDTTLAVVKNILFDVLDKEISLQRNLLKTELSLVNYNELLLQKIRELLFDISKTNEYALRADQESAIERIENSHKEALIIAAAGIFLGFTLLFFLIKDITQTNLYRKKLETEKDRAEKLAAAKEIFLSRMSHELSTPLHSISGFTNLLEKEIPHQSKLRKFINGISSSNLYLNELISNILEQAKINAGTYKLESSRIYIPDLSCELELLFKHRQEEQRNEFRISYSEDLKKYLVVIDRVKLKQVLVNLLSNAFKFTKEGSIFLRFALKPHPERHKLQIK
ncbi:MAG TPA: HAMP domain-containing sensor histidine kinase, partial [Cyclobacteriaceae bacterium]|nr:HAMP domain-containing sensor histidine kinase [Cyclobacteriaceae bacterium]